MIKMNGVVEMKRRDGKAIKVGENWFSVMASSPVLDSINKGDYVEFTYTEKPSPSGEPYRNIKGSVTKVPPPAAAPVTGAGMMKGTASASGFIGRTFPVPALAPERSIIRQNSLGHAVEIVTQMTAFGNCEEAAERTIEIARMFEAYSAGDLDVEMVDEEIKKMLAKE
jgi:hypothetical protein